MSPEKHRALVIKEILRHVEYDGYKGNPKLINKLLDEIKTEDFIGDKWVSGFVVKKKRKPCLKISFLENDKILKTKYLEL